MWEPCGNRACDSGLTHHCLRDAPLWTVYAATGVRRSEALGMKWSLVRWDEGAIELGWVVVEEGNAYRLRKLTKDGDANAIIRGEPRRGLSKRPAPLTGLHHGPVRALT